MMLWMMPPVLPEDQSSERVPGPKMPKGPVGPRDPKDPPKGPSLGAKDGGTEIQVPRFILASPFIVVFND